MSSLFQPNSCSAVMAQRGYSRVTNQKAFFQQLRRREEREEESGQAEGEDGRAGGGCRGAVLLARARAQGWWRGRRRPPLQADGRRCCQRAHTARHLPA